MSDDKAFAVVACVALLVIASDGCRCAAPKGDSPLVVEARKVAKNVPPGAARRVCCAFEHPAYLASGAQDLVGMLGMQGASYVVKAPRSAGGRCHLSVAVKYLVNGGAPKGEMQVERLTESSSRPDARCWLVDILTWPDLLSFHEGGFGYSVRVRLLDSDEPWMLLARGYCEYPEAIRSQVRPGFGLFQPWGQDVGIDKEVALACYYNGRRDKQAPETTDPGEAARNSQVGCVFCIRVSEDEEAGTHP